VTDRCDLLVVAAFAPELAGFDGLLGSPRAAEVGGLEVVALPVGIGMVAAAIGTAARLERGCPRAVILVGTCGAYPGSGLSILDVVVARTTWVSEPAVHEGLAAFPDRMPVRFEANGPMTDAMAAAGARRADIATTLAITTEDDLATRLAAHAAVEHLEAFAVASACASKGVPFCAVLGVANSVGSRGRAEWRAQHDAAGRAASAHVVRWIQSGAEGLPA
jgi:futalosine hydrolase